MNVGLSPLMSLFVLAVFVAPVLLVIGGIFAASGSLAAKKNLEESQSQKQIAVRLMVSAVVIPVGLLILNILVLSIPVLWRSVFAK